VRRIVIVASPRTGSTLLLLSLRSHPLAVNGGEWFNPRLAEINPEAWHRKQSAVPCNLVKIFGHERHCAGFDELLSGACTVHLWREDREAQVASWRRACQTGQWVQGQSPGAYIWEYPDDAEGMIAAGDAMGAECEFSWSYEYLIANWDECVAAILQAADWPAMRLQMAIEKQRLAGEDS
jgi:LPS sulfotransferase NodH